MSGQKPVSTLIRRLYETRTVSNLEILNLPLVLLVLAKYQFSLGIKLIFSMMKKWTFLFRHLTTTTMARKMLALMKRIFASVQA